MIGISANIYDINLSSIPVAFFLLSINHATLIVIRVCSDPLIIYCHFPSKWTCFYILYIPPVCRRHYRDQHTEYMNKQVGEA